MNSAKPLLLLALVLATHLAAADSATNTITPDQLLLKDYRPRSIYKVPVTPITRARFPVIDIHSHAYPKTSQQIDEWVRTMDAMGIEKTVVLTGATGKRFDELVAQYRPHRDRFSLWSGFDYKGFVPGTGAAAVAELERCARAGAEGVGELGDKGGGAERDPDGGAVHFDDPRMDALFEKCAELGLPVNVHVGDPKWMYEPMDQFNDGLMNAYHWRLDNQTNILSHAEVVATLERTAQRHPRTTFIACHFANCSDDLSILGGMLDRLPNLFADTSARYGESAAMPRYMRAFYEKYQDRLLYGTDLGTAKEMYPATFRILETSDEHFYDRNISPYHWPLHGFALKDEVLQKVYSGNARKILH